MATYMDIVPHKYVKLWSRTVRRITRAKEHASDLLLPDLPNVFRQVEHLLNRALGYAYHAITMFVKLVCRSVRVVSGKLGHLLSIPGHTPVTANTLVVKDEERRDKRTLRCRGRHLGWDWGSLSRNWYDLSGEGKAQGTEA